MSCCFGLPLAAVGGAGDGKFKFQPTLTGSTSPYQGRITVRLRNTRRTERAGTRHRVKFWCCSRKIRWRGFVAWIGVHDTVAPHGLVSEQYLVTAKVSAPTFTMQTRDGCDAPRRKLELGA